MLGLPVSENNSYFDILIHLRQHEIADFYDSLHLVHGNLCDSAQLEQHPILQNFLKLFTLTCFSLALRLKGEDTL